MPISEDVVFGLVQDMRSANLRFRDAARAQIAAEYEKLQAMPKQDRLAALNKRANDVKDYLFNQWPACDDENAGLALQNLRAVLKEQFGEVADDELHKITARVQRAIDHDRHDELRSMMKASGKSAGKAHTPRTKIGV